jgi:uncharacterized membrane protein YbhN (UPF0104 family)
VSRSARCCAPIASAGRQDLLPTFAASCGPRRVPITILGSLATAVVLALLLAERRDEFAAALSMASLWPLGLTALLQTVALLARSEAWHLSIQAAGGEVRRRVLYRASSMQVLGSVINGSAAWRRG